MSNQFLERKIKPDSWKPLGMGKRVVAMGDNNVVTYKFLLLHKTTNYEKYVQTFVDT